MLRISLAGLGDLALIERTWSIRMVMDLNEIMDVKDEAEERHHERITKENRRNR